MKPFSIPGGHFRIGPVSALLALLPVVAGCGSTGDFLGTWHYTDGLVTITCDDDELSVEPEAEILFAEGIDSDLMLSHESGCHFDLSVDGRVASALPDQTCMFEGLDGDIRYTASEALQTYTWTLSEDGATIAVSGTADATLEYETGETYACTITESSTLARAEGA